MDPYERFPELAWEIIFANLQTAEEKLKLMKVHSKLEKQFKLYEKELHFLAVSKNDENKALPVLLNYFENSQKRTDTPTGQKQLKDNRKLMLCCRTVSKESCKAIDTWVNERWQNKACVPLIFTKFYPEIGSIQDVQRFMTAFQNHPVDRFPILSRTAVIGAPPRFNTNRIPHEQWQNIIMRREEEYAQGLRSILLQVGAGLKGLELSLREDQMPSPIFRTFLQLTPNLKSFGFCLELPILRAGDAGLLLPDLPNLENLSLSSWKRTISKATHEHANFAQFEKYFPQLKILEIKDFEFQNWKAEYNMSGQFPKLQQLKLTNINICSMHTDEVEDKLINLLRSLHEANKLCLIEVTFRGEEEAMENLQLVHILQEGILSLNTLFENVKWVGKIIVENRVTHQILQTLQFKRID